jgi:HEAT repeat protein
MKFPSLSVYLICLLTTCNLLFSAPSELLLASKIQSYIILKDLLSAQVECRNAIRNYPDVLKLRELFIKVLSLQGLEEEMLINWNNYVRINPQAYDKHDVIEEMAWGVIEKGFCSSSPIVRATSVLASFFSNDIRGVNILYEAVSDNNSSIRSIAMQFIGNMHDDKLKNAAWERYQKEKTWNVHLEAVKAIGKMKISSARSSLKKIIANDVSNAEEKAASIEALVSMTETASREEMESLAKSSRSGLRLLACAVIAQFDLKRDVDLILNLLQDRSPDVRKASLAVLGLLHITEYEGQDLSIHIMELLKDPDPEVAIVAAWLLTIQNHELGQISLANWLNHPSREYRLLASGALKAAGKYGFPLLLNAFKETQDIFVRINLALGLIEQRTNCDEACEALNQAFLNEKSRWMWEQRDLFRYITPSSIKHKDEIPQYPEVVNQITRLEVIQMLTFLHYPKIEVMIKQFLREKPFGITGLASALLLTEGDEGSPEEIKGLLNDPDPKIKIQAGLILALWGKDQEVIDLLQRYYYECGRDMQERILEALGKIGSKSSIPFLIERLGESSQQMRLIAASSLLQCLYN